MRVLDLFSGIGGFSIGLEKSGMTTAAFCEIDDYAKKVLKKNWSDVPIYDDVTKLSKEVLDNDGISVDVICGGFPCQDLSVAGKQKGIEGKRSGLWGEFARLIDEIRPKYAIVENVPNLLSGDRGRWFGRVLGDLAQIGYDAEWHCISASELGARHHRDRVWIIATPQRGMAHPRCELWEQGDTKRMDSYKEKRSSCELYDKSSSKRQCDKPTASYVGNSTSNGWDENQSETQRSKSTVKESERGRLLQSEGASDVSNPNCKGSQGSENTRSNGENEQIRQQLLTRLSRIQGRAWEVEPEVGRVAHGIPLRSHRLRCLGNAVVPQIPELIGKAIMDAES
jgi:DNA (cytosine-5)-methyltransferase 1|tara:strand:- start:224 stop:1240 length:1017 start_codon:yes stop_codon:yes gene_type:complete